MWIAQAKLALDRQAKGVDMWIDAHAHVDRFDLVGPEATQAALDEIAEHHILTLSNSMDPPSYRRNLELADGTDWVLPLFGVHPWNAHEHAKRLRELEPALQQSPMYGELGLDYFFVTDDSAYPQQKKVFEYFLSAAREQRKVVHLHTKGAEKEVLLCLERYNLPRVVVHWYSGPLDIFAALVEFGAYFTMGIEALHSPHVRALTQAIPEDRLLSETDNPGAPKAYIGQPGTPLLIREVVQGLAEVRGTSPEQVEQTVESNLRRLLLDDPWLAEACQAWGW